MVLYYVLSAFAGRLGIEHHLWKFGEAPDYTYSDMNGYGPFLRPVMWFDLYWIGGARCCSSFAADLALGARHCRRSCGHAASCSRARASAGPLRIAVAAERRWPASGWAATSTTTRASSTATAPATTRRALEQRDYELKYKALEREPQPRITTVRVQIDLDPARRSLHARGAYELQNKSATSRYARSTSNLQRRRRGAPSSTVGGSSPTRRRSAPRLSFCDSQLAAAALAAWRDGHARARARLWPRAASGTTRGGHRGRRERHVLSEAASLPSNIGYQRSDSELSDDGAQEVWPPRRSQRMPDLDDPVRASQQRSLERRRLDRLSTATVSTSPGPDPRSPPATCRRSGPRTAGAISHYKMWTPRS